MAKFAAQLLYGPVLVLLQLTELCDPAHPRQRWSGEEGDHGEAGEDGGLHDGELPGDRAGRGGPAVIPPSGPATCPSH